MCIRDRLLSLCEKEEVKGKTRKLNLPYFQRLPVEMDQYTRGELADYVRKEMCIRDRGDIASMGKRKALKERFCE